MTHEEIFQVLRERFGDRVADEKPERGDPSVKVRPEDLLEVARFARDDGRLGFDLLSLIVSLDDRETLGLVYCLDSTGMKHRLLLRVDLPRENPRAPSLEAVWRAADWHEREAFDLMGIVFEGHPNLTRILCAEDWVGHPLRKDYVTPDEVRGVKNVVEPYGG